MDREKFNDLLDQYITGQLLNEGEERLFQLIEQPEYFQYLQERMQSDWENSRYEGTENIELRNILESFVNNTIDANLKPAVVRSSPLYHRWLLAASILFAFATGAYLWFHNNQHQPFIIDNKQLLQDIAPGKEGAILTLADGSQVVLDSLGDGLIAAQNGVQVLLKNGRLAYAASGLTTEEMVYNTMSTPKGRQFRMTLPDGTQVWLNAASSIKYPTQFSGKERIVEISGEVYFETVGNAKMPFKVNVNEETTIEVLGTDFNVNAYGDEGAIKTTLLTGSVKIGDQLLKPGETLFKDKINQANIEQTIAWKNGMFQFKATSIEEVMAQLSRWYDIDVSYEGAKPAIKLSGEIPRSASLQRALKVLEFTGIRFRLEGRKLFVKE